MSKKVQTTIFTVQGNNNMYFPLSVSTPLLEEEEKGDPSYAITRVVDHIERKDGIIIIRGEEASHFVQECYVHHITVRIVEDNE